MKFQDIYDAYFKHSNDSLCDFNSTQIETMLAEAHKRVQSSDVQDCVNELYNIVSACRDVIKSQNEIRKMKLRRYALVDDFKITDTTGKGYYLRDGDKLCTTNNVCITLVKKTSDNILDLAEVGDLIQHKDYGVLEVIGEGLYTIKGAIYTLDITAIYKRLPNGDYKKYEVKQ